MACANGYMVKKEFYHELAIWYSLQHVHILPLLAVVSWGPHDDALCLVSPWQENGNAQDYLDVKKSELTDLEYIKIVNELVRCPLVKGRSTSDVHPSRPFSCYKFYSDSGTCIRMVLFMGISKGCVCILLPCQTAPDDDVFRRGIFSLGTTRKFSFATLGHRPALKSTRKSNRPRAIGSRRKFAST